MNTDLLYNLHLKEMEQEERQLTFGEQLVGVNFNPGGHEKVNRLKEIFAEAADILQDTYVADNLGGMPLSDVLYKHALGEVLNAQMCAVKVVTLKK